jgi:hypothetical protein
MYFDFRKNDVLFYLYSAANYADPAGYYLAYLYTYASSSHLTKGYQICLEIIALRYVLAHNLTRSGHRTRYSVSNIIMESVAALQTLSMPAVKTSFFEPSFLYLIKIKILPLLFPKLEVRNIS